MQDLEALKKRRRAERIALTMPVRVEGKKNAQDSWSEISRFQTVSPFGAGFILQRQVYVGQLVLLTAPLPQKLRRFDYSEQQYRVWGLVRHCNLNESIYEVGVAFLGKHPPSSYIENPAKIYDLVGFDENGLTRINESNGTPSQTEPPKETQRKHTRYSIPVEISLETLDPNQKATAYEITVSENISVGGAAVFASFDVSIGDFVRVNFITYNISILAKVRNRRIGVDGMPRLHLEFIDRQLPIEGIE
jgi:PilZ domain